MSSWLADVAKGKAKAKETGPKTNSEVVWNRINAQKNLMVTREKARIEAEAKAAAEAQAFAEQALNLEFGIGPLTQGVPGVLQGPLAPL